VTVLQLQLLVQEDQLGVQLCVVVMVPYLVLELPHGRFLEVVDSEVVLQLVHDFFQA
jgi:hypothetical protein